MSGWIKLHRSIVDHWVFTKEPINAFGAWIDLLMIVNHKDNKFCIGNKIIEVKKGSTITSILNLSRRWKRGRKWVSSFLYNLEKDEMITQTRNSHFTTITICNYRIFQSEIKKEEQPRNSQGHSHGTAKGTATAHPPNLDSIGSTESKSDTQAQPRAQPRNSQGHSHGTQTRSKEIKTKKRKVIKEKKVFFQTLKNLDFASWPVQPDQEQKEIWYENRRMKKIPITQSIVDRHGNRFQDLEKRGYHVKRCMEMFLDNGWQSPQLQYFDKFPDLKMGKRQQANRIKFRKAEPYRKQPPSEKALDSIKSMRDIIKGIKEKN